MSLRKAIRDLLRDFELNWGVSNTDWYFDIYYTDGSHIRLDDTVEPLKITKTGIKNIVFIGSDWIADFFGVYDATNEIPYEEYEKKGVE